MYSDNSKTSDPHRLLLNFSNKINLKRDDKYVALSNLNINYTWKNKYDFSENPEQRKPADLKKLVRYQEVSTIGR